MSQQTPQGFGPRHQVTWVPVKTGKADRGLTVVLSKSDHRPYPRYGMKIGTTTDDGRLLPFVNPFVDGQKLTPDTLTVKTIDDLILMLQDTKAWILEDATYEAASRLDRQIEHDHKSANWGKQETRHTGKTERKKARQAG